MDINQLLLSGRVGGTDSELVERTNPKTNSSFLSFSFSMAVNDTYGQGDTRVQSTQWINVVSTYNKQANGHFSPVAYMLRDALVSGEPVTIQGKLKSRDFTAQDGSKGTRWEVICSGIGDWIKLESKRNVAPVQAVAPVTAPVQSVAQTQRVAPVQAVTPAYNVVPSAPVEFTQPVVQVATPVQAVNQPVVDVSKFDEANPPF